MGLSKIYCCANVAQIYSSKLLRKFIVAQKRYSVKISTWGCQKFIVVQIMFGNYRVEVLTEMVKPDVIVLQKIHSCAGRNKVEQI